MSRETINREPAEGSRTLPQGLRSANPSFARAIGVAGALGFSAVAVGAFGAHGLRDRLSPAMVEIYKTGALYHLAHALAATAVALGADRVRRAGLIVTLFALGVLVFSGSLYLLAITGMTQLGAITPIGGLCLLAAWALLALEALPARRDPT